MVRRAKAHLALNLARDIKGNKNGFYRYIGDKRKTRGNVGLLLNGAEDMEKAEVRNAILDSDFCETIEFRNFIPYSKYKSIIKVSTILTCLKSKLAQGIIR